MLSFISSLIGSYLEARAIKGVAGELGKYIDNWARLIASIIITSYVTMLIVWGSVTGGLLLKGTNCWIALISGFASGMFLTGAIVYQLWIRSPLTKGISIAIPSKFVEAVLQENVTITERN